MDEAVALQARDRVGDRRIGDPQPAGQIDGARFTGRIDQIGDQLDIVLGDLAPMIIARAAEAFGLHIRLGQAVGVGGAQRGHRFLPGLFLPEWGFAGSTAPIDGGLGRPARRIPSSGSTLP